MQLLDDLVIKILLLAILLSFINWMRLQYKMYLLNKHNIIDDELLAKYDSSRKLTLLNGCGFVVVVLVRVYALNLG